jgi:dethiobiotin synthase
MKLFITGTDTGVGKTIISAWLCLHLNAQYWKPVQTGTADSLTVKRLLNCSDDRILPERYLFQTPVSPHLAASLERRIIDMSELRLPTSNSLIVEGAGGILTPLNDKATMLSLVQQLGLPTIVVARSSLGTINHTCLTLEALKLAGTPVLGVIMNGVKNEDNRRAVAQYGKVPVLDELEPCDPLNHGALKARVPSEQLMKSLNVTV